MERLSPTVRLFDGNPSPSGVYSNSRVDLAAKGNDCKINENLKQSWHCLSSNFNFITLNCQSIKNKVSSVLNYRYENQIDIALL